MSMTLREALEQLYFVCGQNYRQIFKHDFGYPLSTEPNTKEIPGIRLDQFKIFFSYQKLTITRVGDKNILSFTHLSHSKKKWIIMSPLSIVGEIISNNPEECEELVDSFFGSSFSAAERQSLIDQISMIILEYL